MIDASFSRAGRDATVSGAYQYDTGQRLRMYGLPSPSELAGRDDFLSGDIVTVQVQYSFVGDSQTEASIAEWKEEEEGNGYWLAKVPDVYMLKNQDVHVYVYVSYGQTDDSMRAKTIYECVFRPISRPAPSTDVTPDQTNAWDRLVTEVNAAIAGAVAAGDKANAATETTVAAVKAAGEAADRANAASEETEAYFDKLERTTVSAEYIDADKAPSVSVEDKGDYKNVMFQFPRRVATVNGVTVGEDFSVTLTPEDVGAMPATKQTVYTYETTAGMFYAGSSDYIASCRVSVPDLLESDAVIADVVFQPPSTPENIENTLAEWAKVYRIDAYDGYVMLYSLASDIPTTNIRFQLTWAR